MIEKVKSTERTETTKAVEQKGPTFCSHSTTCQSFNNYINWNSCLGHEDILKQNVLKLNVSKQNVLKLNVLKQALWLEDGIICNDSICQITLPKTPCGLIFCQGYANNASTDNASTNANNTHDCVSYTEEYIKLLKYIKEVNKHGIDIFNLKVLNLYRILKRMSSMGLDSVILGDECCWMHENEPDYYSKNGKCSRYVFDRDEQGLSKNDLIKRMAYIEYKDRCQKLLREMGICIIASREEILSMEDIKKLRAEDERVNHVVVSNDELFLKWLKVQLLMFRNFEMMVLFDEEFEEEWGKF